MGERALCLLAPRLWNTLHVEIKSADTLQTFKSKLKTDLFELAYNAV